MQKFYLKLLGGWHTRKQTSISKQLLLDSSTSLFTVIKTPALNSCKSHNTYFLQQQQQRKEKMFLSLSVLAKTDSIKWSCPSWKHTTVEFCDNRQRSDFSRNDMTWAREAHFTWKACAEDTQAHCLCNPKKDSHKRYTTSPKGLLNEDWKAFWYPTI